MLKLFAFRPLSDNINIIEVCHLQCISFNLMVDSYVIIGYHEGLHKFNDFNDFAFILDEGKVKDYKSLRPIIKSKRIEINGKSNGQN